MFYLDFEEKLEKLESEKKSLQKASKESGIDATSKILSIEKKEKAELEKIYSNLSPWQIVKIARHPQRPKTCLLYTSPSPRDMRRSRMPSSA